MSSPQRKRRRVGNTGPGGGSETAKDTTSDDMASTAVSKARVVLILCGSMNPVTNLHLRMFGKWSAQRPCTHAYSRRHAEAVFCTPST